MKKLTRIQKIWLVLIAAGLSVSAFAYIRETVNPIAAVFRSANELFIGIEDFFFSTPVYWIKAFAEQPNEQAEINRIAAENEELKQEIEILKEQLELNSTISDYETIAAAVIVRPTDSFGNTITIDVGYNDGIDGNYAVISNEGMIGRITSVSASTSKVTLLTTENEDSKCSVRILIDENTASDAIFERYNSESGLFVVKLLSTSKSIRQGMKVVTSGMGGVFPAGLLIGTVDSVDETGSSLGVSINVKPAADFSSFSYVTVVKRIGSAENED